MKVQWSDSESYRLEHILQMIENLPNCNRNPFSKKDWTIYDLHNYAVHIMPEMVPLFCLSFNGWGHYPFHPAK